MRTDPVPGFPRTSAQAWKDVPPCYYYRKLRLSSCNIPSILLGLFCRFKEFPINQNSNCTD